MHCPGGRGLGGEAGPGPCHSLGSGLLPPSPLAHSGSILVPPSPARGRQRRLCPSPGTHAGRGRGALAQGKQRAPCPTPTRDSGHGYPQRCGGRQRPPKSGPVPPCLPFTPPGPAPPIVSSPGFQYPRAGPCPRDRTPAGDPPAGGAPQCPGGPPGAGGSRAPPRPGGSGGARRTPAARGSPVSAPAGGASPDAAGMRLRHHPILQECPAGGDGAGWGRPAPAIPGPSTQPAAACPPPPGRGPPHPSWGPLCDPGLRAPRSGAKTPVCHLFHCCWAGKWVIRAQTGAHPVGRGCSEGG